ncbi:hypothetical protein OROHE_025700 [Orobanche hederae]
MGGSRRKYKSARTEVRVGLPKQNPNVFRPAFNLPPKLKFLLDLISKWWGEKGSVIENYKSFGVVSTPIFSSYGRVLLISWRAMFSNFFPPVTRPRRSLSQIDSGSDDW